MTVFACLQASGGCAGSDAQHAKEGDEESVAHPARRHGDVKHPTEHGHDRGEDGNSHYEKHEGPDGRTLLYEAPEVEDMMRVASLSGSSLARSETTLILAVRRTVDHADIDMTARSSAAGTARIAG
ncbi:hypothetical protein GCM10009528_35860 [Kineococcus aurantiacus]